MKVIDIMKESAILLGLMQERVAMETVTEENEVKVMADNPEVFNLFNLFKFSIREFCSNYVPITTSIKVKSEDKKYPMSMLKNLIRIQNISYNGQSIKFKIVNRNIIFEEDGEYEISYSTYPEIETTFDEIDFLENFSPDVIVFGLCAYYSLAHGMFTEFEELHEKYVEKAESLKDLKIFNMPARRWE